MTDSTLEVVYRGDIAPGHSMVEVKENLRTLFKADDAQLARLFSGRAVVIRRNLDQDAANRYQQLMERAGAVVQVRAGIDQQAVTSDAESDSAEQEDDASEEGWVLAPLGADLLTRKERKTLNEKTPIHVDVSAISLAPVGSDVLVGAERNEQQDLDVDTSHLSLENTFKPE